MFPFRAMPYSNFHDLNLDWILDQIKTAIEEVTDNTTAIAEIKKNFDDLQTWCLGVGLSAAASAQLLKWKDDGTLATVINQSVFSDINAQIATLNSKVELYVKDFGATGDGVTDDTNALKSIGTALQTVTAKELTIIFERGKTYNINAVIPFDLSAFKHVEFDFNSAKIALKSSFDYYNQGLFTITFNKDLRSSIEIKNCYFDGLGNPPDFSSAATAPLGGTGAFFVGNAKTVKMENCHFSNLFYSACLWCNTATIAEVRNCTGYNVGGRSSGLGGVDRDSRGDALYFGYVGDGVTDGEESSVLVENCHFASWVAITNPTANADETQKNVCQSGRCGIVFGEFATNTKRKTLSIRNSSFYNYQRTIHVEGTSNVSIDVQNTTFEEFGNALFCEVSNLDKVKFTNCTFEKTLNIIGNKITGNGLINTQDSLATDIRRIVFDTCKFTGNYRMISYGSYLDLSFVNCDVEDENLDFYYQCSPKFINSRIRYNKTTFYWSAATFDNCEVTGGYKNNANSNPLLGTASDVSPYFLNGSIEWINSKFKNVKTVPPWNSLLTLIGCTFVVDATYMSSNLFAQNPFECRNCTFTNISNKLISLFDGANPLVLTTNISDCTFTDIGVIMSTTDVYWKAIIHGCRFTHSSNPCTCFVNVNGSYSILSDLWCLGLASGEIAGSQNCIKTNCYRLANGVVPVAI